MQSSVASRRRIVGGWWVGFKRTSIGWNTPGLSRLVESRIDQNNPFTNSWLVCSDENTHKGIQPVASTKIGIM